MQFKLCAAMKLYEYGTWTHFYCFTKSNEAWIPTHKLDIDEYLKYYQAYPFDIMLHHGEPCDYKSTQQHYHIIKAKARAQRLKQHD